mmetsp:Transcript_64882/g.177951  ORF Transcript_64882/g.177951 Transcript_64882/m.177951 type:complete len:219 (-) Transcript_64882:363-1019(-)
MSSRYSSSASACLPSCAAISAAPSRAAACGRTSYARRYMPRASSSLPACCNLVARSIRSVWRTSAFSFSFCLCASALASLARRSSCSFSSRFSWCSSFSLGTPNSTARWTAFCSRSSCLASTFPRAAAAACSTSRAIASRITADSSRSCKRSIVSASAWTSRAFSSAPSSSSGVSFPRSVVVISLSSGLSSCSLAARSFCSARSISLGPTSAARASSR